MGDLSCDSESVPMEGHNTSFICEDDPVLLEEALPPSGQTLCSTGELHHSKDGTHDNSMDGDSLETEVDISDSPSSGTKRGKEGDGNSQSHVVSDYSEPKESSSYEPSPSFLPTLRLISAMKGGKERSGEFSYNGIEAHCLYRTILNGNALAGGFLSALAYVPNSAIMVSK